MKNKVTILFLFICLSYGASSQIPWGNSSLFYYNLLRYNSAFTGSGDYRVNLFSRHLWSGIENYPVSEGLVADMPFRNLKNLGGFKGLGISLLKTEEGTGEYKKYNASLTSAFDFRAYKNIRVSLGARVSYIKGSIDWDNFIFSSQINPIDGVVGSTPNKIGTYNNETEGCLDFGVGFIITTKHNFQKTRKNKTKVTGVFGANFEHILQTGDTNFTNDDTEIPLLLTLHAGALISRNKRNSSVEWFAPAIVYERQTDINTILAGSNITFSNSFLERGYSSNRYSKNKNKQLLMVGLWTRISDQYDKKFGNFASLIGSVGLLNIKLFNISNNKYAYMNIAFSFDITTIKGFKPGNTYEIILSFNSTRENKNYVPCPNPLGFQ